MSHMETQELATSYLVSANKRLLEISAGISWLAESIMNSKSYWELATALASVYSPSDDHNFKQGVEPRCVHVIAVGKSGHVGNLFTSMLVSVGIQARFLHPVEAFHGDLGSVSPGDVAVLLSQSGQTHEVLQVVPFLKKKSCKLFAVTSLVQSPLAKVVHCVLQLPPEPESCPLKQAPISSTVYTLALCQSLVASTMELRKFSLETYALNHPGGAIGKRIFLKVSDVMLPYERLAICSQEETFSNALMIMTEASLGALLVCNGKKLLGLVGERDLRLALKNFGPKVFGIQVNQFMNSCPLTIYSNKLAKAALDIMENNAKPLNMLPVIDEVTGDLQGLIRLRDLIESGL